MIYEITCSYKISNAILQKLVSNISTKQVSILLRCNMLSIARALPKLASVTTKQGSHLVAPFSSKSFDSIVREALSENGMSDRADTILGHLSDAAVTRTEIAMKLNDSDWNDIGVKVGERVVLQKALAEAEGSTEPLQRQFSRGGKVGTHHQRSL